MDRRWIELAIALFLPVLAFPQGGAYTSVRSYPTASSLSTVACTPSSGPIAFVWNDGTPANNGIWECVVTNTWSQILGGGGGGGAVSGDLSGTVPGSITVIGLRGNPVSASAPSSVTQFLNWSGTQWQPLQPNFNQLTGTVSNAQLASSYSGTGSCSPNIVQALNANAAPTCTSAGAGTVTSVTFTGDGTILSSTPSLAVTSSGTLTATRASFAAHQVLGNFTGSPALPTVGSLTTAELPFTYTGNTTLLPTSTGTFTNGHCVSTDANHNFVDFGGACGGGGGGGTVTSVGFTAPSGYVVSGSPVIASGTISMTTPVTSSGDLIIGNGTNSSTRLGIGTLGQFLSVVAGPTLGWAGPFSLNGLTGLTQTFLTAFTGTDFSITSTGSSHTFSIPTVSASNRGLATSSLFNTWNGKAATVTCAPNTFANVIGTATSTCAAAVIASTAPLSKFANAISAAGSLAYVQPAFTDISGTAAVTQGGTGLATLPANVLLKGNGTSPVASSNITDTGTAVTIAVNTTVNGTITSGGPGPPTVGFGPGGPSIVAQAGAPSGACITGSLYLRTDGGAGTTLYVCESTAWVGK